MTPCKLLPREALLRVPLSDEVARQQKQKAEAGVEPRTIRILAQALNHYVTLQIVIELYLSFSILFIRIDQKTQAGSTTQHIRVRHDLFIFETEFLHF